MVQRRVNVVAPAITPASATLLDYVSWQDAPDSKWLNGITYRTQCGDTSTTFDYCSVTGSPTLPNPTKEQTGDISYRGATPFTVYSRIDCSPPGFWNDAENLVMTQLAQTESRTVETAFWTGEIADGAGTVYPHLASNVEVYDTEAPLTVLLQPAASVPITGAINVVRALSALEESLGECYNAVGTIFVTMHTFNRMVAEHLLDFRNGRYVTKKGNWVVPGYGFPGTSPAGADRTPGQAWMYATGNVFGYRTAPKQVGSLEESFRRDVNTLEMIVERTYLITWDCCLFAVLTDNTGE